MVQRPSGLGSHCVDVPSTTTAEDAILILNAVTVALLNQFREQQQRRVREPMNMDERISQSWESGYNNIAHPLDGFLYFSPKDHAELEHLSSCLRRARSAIIGFQYKVFFIDCLHSWVMRENEGRTIQIIPQTLGSVSFCS